MNFPLPVTVPEAVRISAATIPETAEDEPPARVSVPVEREPDTSAFSFTVMSPVPFTAPKTARLSALSEPSTTDTAPSPAVAVPAVTVASDSMADPSFMV